MNMGLEDGKAALIRKILDISGLRDIDFLRDLKEEYKTRSGISDEYGSDV